MTLKESTVSLRNFADTGAAEEDCLSPRSGSAPSGFFQILIIRHLPDDSFRLLRMVAQMAVADDICRDLPRFLWRRGFARAVVVFGWEVKGLSLSVATVRRV